MTNVLNAELVTRKNRDQYVILTVQSDSNPNVKYRVDITNGRCSCPGWTMHGHRKPCKHLRAAGYKG